jgi:hypothetical protein
MVSKNTDFYSEYTKSCFPSQISTFVLVKPIVTSHINYITLFTDSCRSILSRGSLIQFMASHPNYPRLILLSFSLHHDLQDGFLASVYTDQNFEWIFHFLHKRIVFS